MADKKSCPTKDSLSSLKTIDTKLQISFEARNPGVEIRQCSDVITIKWDDWGKFVENLQNVYNLRHRVNRDDN